MNYTLQQLKDRVDTLIKEQGETAYCVAWIYTKEDIYRLDVDGEPDYFASENPVLVDRVFSEVGNDDHIYTTIQECVDAVSEEQYMIYQEELEDESPLVE